jgi:hypothetical protein
LGFGLFMIIQGPLDHWMTPWPYSCISIIETLRCYRV